MLLEPTDQTQGKAFLSGIKIMWMNQEIGLRKQYSHKCLMKRKSESWLLNILIINSLCLNLCTKFFCFHLDKLEKSQLSPSHGTRNYTFLSNPLILCIKIVL